LEISEKTGLDVRFVHILELQNGDSACCVSCIFLYSSSWMQVHQTETTKGLQMKNAKSSVLYLFQEFSSDEDANISTDSIKSAIRVSGSALLSEESSRPKKSNSKGHCKKSRYRDLDEAIEVLHRIQRYRGYAEEAGRTLTHRNEQRAYKCPICQGAHLTSKAAFGEVVGNVAA